jgi:hypothetical protein
MSDLFGFYGDGSGVDFQDPVARNLTSCKTCGSQYSDTLELCPVCENRALTAERNVKKLQLSAKAKDVTTPSTYSQMEELLAMHRELAENIRQTRNSVRGIQWGLFGLMCLTVVATFAVR